LPLVFIEPKSADLSPGHCAHSIFYATWPGHEVVHGHMVVPTGGFMEQWLWFPAFKEFIPSMFGDGMVMEMDGSAELRPNRPSCLLDDGQWILVNMDWSLLSVGLSDHPLELGEPGPFICPFAASLDSGLSDIFHFFSVTSLYVFCAMIITSVAVFYMIVFLLLYVVSCRDDIFLDSSFLHFISLHLTLDTAFYHSVFCRGS